MPNYKIAKEDQYNEHKFVFETGKMKKEIAAMLNASLPGELVSICFGIEDGELKLSKKYKEIDPSYGIDIVILFLNKNNIFKNVPDSEKNKGYILHQLSNGGFAFDIYSPEIIIPVNKADIYYRVGSSSYSISFEQYTELIKRKGVMLLALTHEQYDKDNFKELRNFIAKTGIDFDLEEFLFKSISMKKSSGTTKLTQLGLFFRDDQQVSIKINDTVYKGPLFKIYTEVVERLITDAETNKRLQPNKITRQTMKQLIGNEVDTIIREAVSNIIIHSRFKGVVDTPMEITCDNDGVALTNKHATPDMAQDYKTAGRLYSINKNVEIFNAMRLLGLVEGEGKGFDLFVKYKKFVKIEITHNTFKLTIKGVK